MLNRLKTLLYSISILLILSFTIVYLQSCEQDFSTSPGSGQFPPEIEAIFNTPYTSNNITCTTSSCHDNSQNAARKLNLLNWQETLNGSESGTMVIPYNGFWSHMTTVLNSDTIVAPVTTVLLPEYHKIDQSKVATVMNWINDGAKDVNGNIAFANTLISDKGFITNQAADVVAVIQPNENRVIRLVPVGGRSSLLDAPHYVNISPDKRFIYVSLIQEGYVEKYDANTYVQVGRMQAGQSPAHIEISPDGHSGFVTNFESSGTITTTTKFNADNMTVTGIFSEPRMKGAHGMALTRDGNWLYVTSEIGEFIFKIQASNFYASDSTFIKEPVDPSVPPSGNGTGNFRPYQVLLSPDDSIIYVTLRGANEVRLYRASDLSQIKSISLGANAFPLLMKLTNDGQYLFVCNRNNNSVSIINTSTQSLQTTVTGVGIQPHGVDFTADGQYAMIACETQSGFDGHHPQVGSIKIGVSRLIQVSNFSLLTTKLEMGSFPAGIVIVK